LDLIADAYIPALTLFTIALLWKEFREGRIKHVINSSLRLVLSVNFIYLMMFIDQALGIWPALGLDYSTHTALALVFVTFIGIKSVKLRVASTLSIMLYAALMIYQEYHSLLDILTTALVILSAIYWLQLKSLYTKNSLS